VKFRYLIERGAEEMTFVDGKLATADLYLSEATPSDPSYRYGTRAYATVEAVQAAAQEAARYADAEVELKWKPAPASWGEDALFVSQYLDDGVEENRDS
jgi:hypothetical protein